MAIFISYSSQDRTSLDALTTALKRAQQKVWFDQELGGGDAWWNAILEQIRSCEVFIVALSNNWLQSKPSLAELRYAQALNRPILPVKVGPVDSVRVNPVSTLQIIDYQNPTVDAGIQLVTAIHAMRDKAAPLPSPLPEEPPVPFGYIMRLGNDLSEKELTPAQQLQLLLELRTGLDEDGDDPSARGDIAQLLRMLRMRHDVTYRTRTEIDNVLAEIEAKDGAAKGVPSGAPAKASAAPAAAPAAPAAAPQARPATGHAAPAPSSRGSNKKLLIIGGAALAAVLAIVLIVVFASGGNTRKPTAANPSGAATGASNGASAPAETGSILLGAADIGNVLGDPNMKESAHSDQLRAPQGTLSDQECLSAFEPFQESVYRPHDPTAIHTQVVQSSGDVHRVVEAVAKFPSAEKARAFVEASAGKWRACANKTVTFTGPSKSTEWSFGEVNGAAPKITMTRAETDNNTRTCQHVLGAAGDLVIEVQACGNDITDGGAKLADQIMARANK
ncbi:sensor domain-containing protein [Mycobacterium sp. Z3061]|uniref:sensor domain-containing protein n=1 Tax=Mycobacterium sp. Z3061 TaxID=3073562 RepID=UPI002873434A|nr:sensor domain-containing protein [Mycobacterium sp. Z3061]